MYCAVLVTRSDRGLEKAVQINTENNDLFSDRMLLFCLLNQMLISDWIGGTPGKEGGARPRPDTGSQSGAERNTARFLIGQRPLLRLTELQEYPHSRVSEVVNRPTKSCHHSTLCSGPLYFSITKHFSFIHWSSNASE